MGSSYAVDGRNERALVETISIAVKQKPEFVLQKVDGVTRTQAGAQYTDPATTAEYFTNQNYLIAPLALDKHDKLLIRKISRGDWPISSYEFCLINFRSA